MEVTIFVNGPELCTEKPIACTNKANLIIAADGGANHCANLNIWPDILIGDLDSVNNEFKEKCIENNTEILKYPKDKDATDLELAIDLAKERGAQKIDFFGLLGGRWDMSLANIFLIGSSRYANIEMVVHGGESLIHILHPGKHPIKNKEGKTISLLPLFQDIDHITLEGFRYPLVDTQIKVGSTLGVSNVITAQIASIHHTQGVLLAIISE